MLTLENVQLTRGAFTLTADFAVDAPGIVAVIGPSGSGKSTLLSLIAGFETPEKGRVLWDGQDLTGIPPGKRPVAVLFQDNNLFPHLDLVSNVALGASPQARPSPDVLNRARQALSGVGLSGYESRKPGALSGGQQSRAALARVFLTDRQIVLMDEAFSALGPALRSEMLGLVKELLPKALILMITHDPDDAKRWTERTIFVDDGQVHSPVGTEELFADPPEALSRYLA
ncbi:MAG: ATP-binding cassette domain-containing protein [Silicimonas sp.]|nr:ATP-binding cassette domain-containing protein [Silicimonas sp.]NNL34851.1 ATP-binding cassette domain-containing protein [Silicimonas sp.]